MRAFRAFLSLLRGTTDEDAFLQYKSRLLDWAKDVHGLSKEEYESQFSGRYLDPSDRDLFLDFLLSVSKDSPSYITDHPAMLADRKKLHDRFGLPVLTMSELRNEENKRLDRLDSPLRL